MITTSCFGRAIHIALVIIRLKIIFHQTSLSYILFSLLQITPKQDMSQCAIQALSHFLTLGFESLIQPRVLPQNGGWECSLSDISPMLVKDPCVICSHPCRQEFPPWTWQNISGVWKTGYPFNPTSRIESFFHGADATDDEVYTLVVGFTSDDWCLHALVITENHQSGVIDQVLEQADADVNGQRFKFHDGCLLIWLHYGSK